MGSNFYRFKVSKWEIGWKNWICDFLTLTYDQSQLLNEKKMLLYQIICFYYIYASIP